MPFSLNNLCLNLEMPTLVAKAFFTALAVLPCNSSSRTMRVSPDVRKHTSMAARFKVICMYTKNDKQNIMMDRISGDNVTRDLSKLYAHQTFLITIDAYTYNTPWCPLYVSSLDSLQLQHMWHAQATTWITLRISGCQTCSVLMFYDLPRYPTIRISGVHHDQPKKRRPSRPLSPPRVFRTPKRKHRLQTWRKTAEVFVRSAAKLFDVSMDVQFRRARECVCKSYMQLNYSEWRSWRSQWFRDVWLVNIGDIHHAWGSMVKYLFHRAQNPIQEPSALRSLEKISSWPHLTQKKWYPSWELW